ncbi:MAG TPA: DnaJ domain-containing protein [Alphaproteobacteria bacterium]|nr:DnaJ domain-containing protein [Alphaproteobacteria bacterium]
MLVSGLALLAFIGLALLAMNAAVRADPRRLARGLRWTAIAVGVAAVGLLALRAGPGMLVALLGLGWPLLMRWRAARARARAAQGPAAGGASAVRTRYLAMSLDHDTGRLDGEVLEGRFRGRRLSELPTESLLLLWGDVQDDADSAAVMAGYLDRVDPNWRDFGGGAAEAQREAPPARGGMAAEEAREILGVGPDATTEAIREAHRRLMLANHPDRGGSTYLAARINQAKDVLLRGRA